MRATPVDKPERSHDDFIFFGALAGGHLDRRGPVVGGDAVPAGEAGHVADVADDGRGDDRADSEQPGQADAGRLDRGGMPVLRVAQLGVEAPQVIEESSGRLTAAAPTAPAEVMALP